MLELWAQEDGKLAGMDAAVTACPNDFTGVHLGASYYADRDFAYKGVTASLRLQHGEVFAPFVGLGVLVGSAERETDGTHDGVDNNGDGLVDEPGERRRLMAFSAYAYPEAGLSLWTERGGVTVSARRFYGSELTGSLIYNVGFTLVTE